MEKPNNHYSKLGIEPIEVMKKNFTPEEFIGFLKGNVLKYAMRIKGDDLKKVDDLNKLIQYSKWLIDEICPTFKQPQESPVIVEEHVPKPRKKKEIHRLTDEEKEKNAQDPDVIEMREQLKRINKIHAESKKSQEELEVEAKEALKSIILD